MGRPTGTTLALLGGTLLAACDLILPSVVPGQEAIATNVNTEWRGNTAVLSVAPWPLDETVAFLCLGDTRNSFTLASPVPPDDAGCVPLDITPRSGGVDLRFTAPSLEVFEEFATQGSWFLAIAGRRASLGFATTIQVNTPPDPSDLGPS